MKSWLHLKACEIHRFKGDVEARQTTGKREKPRCRNAGDVQSVCSTLLGPECVNV